MSEYKVALRYAKSLLEEAVEKKSEDKIKVDMVLFLDACNSNRDLRVVLGNPIINFDKKYSVLKSIFEGKIESLSLNFFHLASKKGRASLLIAMAKEFLNQYNNYKNISSATLSTVMSMDSKLKMEFIKILEEGFGKKVELEEITDPDLIGGFVLKINDRQIDESIKSRLNQLKLNLIDQSYKALV